MWSLSTYPAPGCRMPKQVWNNWEQALLEFRCIKEKGVSWGGGINAKKGKLMYRHLIKYSEPNGGNSDYPTISITIFQKPNTMMQLNTLWSLDS